MIAHLEEFVTARLAAYDDPTFRIGDWTGVRGDMSSIASLALNARMVDAFAMMNPAQASSLVPLIRFEKVPVPKAREIFPDIKDSEEIIFPSFYDPRTLLSDGQSHPETAAIGDIAITEKFHRPGSMKGTEVRINFKFDSVRTFVKNQNSGIRFLDLLPNKKTQARSGGVIDVAYSLLMTVGWQVPDDKLDSLFPGPRGKNLIAELETGYRQYSLQYGGKHELSVTEDGSVNLDITYTPIPLARTLQGDTSQAREDIFGPVEGIGVKAVNDKIEELKKELKATTDSIAELSKKINKAHKEHRAKQRKKLEEVLKANKALEKVDATLVDSLFDVDDMPGWIPFSMGQDGEGTSLMGKFKDKKKYLEMKKTLKNEIKVAREKLATETAADRTEIEKKKMDIRRINGELDTAKSWDNLVLSDRYGSLVRDMFLDGHIHMLDITAAEQKKHTNSNKNRQIKASKAYKGKLLDKLLRPDAATDVQAKKYNSEMAADAVKKAAKAAHKKRKDAKPAPTAAKEAKPLNAIGVGGGTSAEDRRVYYFYFGDLMDRIMKNWYNYSKEDPLSGDSEHKRHKTESLLLGDFYYNLKESDKKPIQAYSYHMGDFPISLRLFTKWFSETFIKRGVSYISLSQFLSEFGEGFFKGEGALANVPKHQVGPMLMPNLPAQDWTMAYNRFSSGVKLDRGFNQIARGGYLDARSEFFKNLFKSNYSLSTDDEKYEYHMFGPVGENSPPVPDYTIYLGSDTALIKSINFSKAGGGKAVRTARMVQGGLGDWKLGWAQMYEVDIEMMGVPFIKPNQTFKLDTGVFGINTINSSSDQEALDDMLPSVLRVVQVEHKFGDGNFSTSAKCKPVGAAPKVFYNDDGDEIGDFSRPGVPAKSKKKKKKKNKGGKSKTSDPKKQKKQCIDSGGKWDAAKQKCVKK